MNRDSDGKIILPDDDIVVYAEGALTCSVCSPFDAQKTAERFNEINLCGTQKGWVLSDDKFFRGGNPNPCPCDDKPETRKHYLFDC